jgi:2,3-bisphosphoglycerate-independent phosphoglycerate mutase
MARVLILFLDGIGLNGDNPNRNPFAVARMPTLENLLGRQRLLASSAPYVGQQATLLAVDARLGVDGVPQSATGQACLLTGRNVPAEIGSHYGPKPNPPITAILKRNNLFAMVLQRGGSAALLNAYPPRYFEAIRSGRRLYSAIPLAATTASLALKTAEDLQNGQALAADFTGAGWAAQPGFPPAPIYTPDEAGAILARLSQQVDLAWFEYWLTDYAGHRGTMAQSVSLLETFDAVLGGLVGAWEMSRDLIVITSDHGNMENLDKRGHTNNPVPAILIGPKSLRRDLAAGLIHLPDFTPAVLRTIFDSKPPRNG